MTMPMAMTRKLSGSAGGLPLAELQHRFQEAILAGNDAIFDLIPDNSRTGRDVLFGVYRHAYGARLVEIVGKDFPLLARYIGDDRFDALARAYIAAHPSRTSNARYVSQALPEFLHTYPLSKASREIGELAHLERALSDAFDAEDAPTLKIEDLSRYAPERWGDLAFDAHPSAARLDFETNAFAIWNALEKDETPPAATALAERQNLIVWRREATSSVRSLGAEEAMMWDEAAKGARFAHLCELVATFSGDESAALRAAQYLQGWIGAGLLSRAHLARPMRRSRCGP